MNHLTAKRNDMQSIILKTATRYLMPLMLLFSVFIWLRGHNEPGGGFVGGLIAAASFALYSIAFGTPAARDLLRVDPRALMGTGLLMAVVSGLIPLFANELFLKGLWLKQEIPVVHKLGTPVLFDTGVYLTVIGISLLIIFELSDDLANGQEI
jgi:multicomponent Na+:H+ antiporter subunit B